MNRKTQKSKLFKAVLSGKRLQYDPKVIASFITQHDLLVSLQEGFNNITSLIAPNLSSKYSGLLMCNSFFSVNLCSFIITYFYQYIQNTV